MKNSVSYKQAVKDFAVYFNQYTGGDMFGASAMLALLFGKDKEVTMKDLLKIRESLELQRKD